ncbi:MAG: DUF1738 domain-containing protein [Deltaproteobacteria bacterium]|nr:DUF1738 domain-containing protein [Deltaproteobacteria bacterium]
MSVYSTITEQIISQLEQGTVPWRQPWTSRGVPRNLLSLKPYRGINVWLLLARPYPSPYWATFKQVQEIGGTVRKGEQGTKVVFWKFADKEQNEDRDQQSSRPSSAPLVRSYVVFNTEQCTLPASLTDRIAAAMGETPEPITACEQVIANMPQRPTIEHRGDRAFYLPLLDTVTVPHPSQFVSMADYYATLYHECLHATGHSSRLARPGVTEGARFASHAYSQEELVAEFGAAFLCGVTGIAPQTIDNAAAYIGHWIARLYNEKTLLVHAASQAQRAVDFILNVSPAQRTESETTS